MDLDVDKWMLIESVTLNDEIGGGIELLACEDGGKRCCRGILGALVLDLHCEQLSG